MSSEAFKDHHDGLLSAGDDHGAYALQLGRSAGMLFDRPVNGSADVDGVVGRSLEAWPGFGRFITSDAFALGIRLAYDERQIGTDSESALDGQMGQEPVPALID